MSDNCKCCEGLEVLTPQNTANRPGLTALHYRVGTHSSFLESMKARLSNWALNVPMPTEQDTGAEAKIYPLRELTTRNSDDFAIALLDGWACVADVLSFYQERIANEGYMRTATERRSILELARLIGYKLRPGVSASTYLAYTLDKDSPPTTIPVGTRAQSIPGPGEMPQSFETSDPIEARVEWNALKPRTRQPQYFQPGLLRNYTRTVYFKGTATNLKPNDGLLVDFGSSQEFYRIKTVKTDAPNDRTLVTVNTASFSTGSAVGVTTTAVGKADGVLSGIGPLLSQLTKPPSLPPPNRKQLSRSAIQVLANQADVFPQLLTQLRPELSTVLYPAWQNAVVTPTTPAKFYAFRVKAGVFANNAQQKIRLKPVGDPVVFEQEFTEWKIKIPGDPVIGIVEVAPAAAGDTYTEENNTVWLDAPYEQLAENSWVVLERPNSSGSVPQEVITQAKNVKLSSRSEYNFTGKSTQVELGRDWLDRDKDTFDVIRRTNVFAQSEELTLAEEMVTSDVEGDTLELDALYNNLDTGRWLIVAGERADIEGTQGVKVAELVMLAAAEQKVQHISRNSGDPVDAPITDSDDKEIERPDDKIHTFLKLSTKLAYKYKRETVTVYGNVAKATHGETRQEVLGGGNAAKALQSFTLRSFPLTYVSANNPSGVESTLKVYVNQVRWHEANSLALLGPTDRSYVTQTDDSDKTTVTFGTGQNGLRLPTGLENVRAVYRNGIGKPGNVKAEQISLLMSRPLGVKAVINPLPATGGANREGITQARRNAPLAVAALDRLVSVQDYEDFARNFGGIGKASAKKLTDGQKQFVHLTIAGADDIPIAYTSDLYQNLRQAVRDFGDPYQAFKIEVRELLPIFISAKIKVLADYLWEAVETDVRAALLDRFSFEQRELGQPVFLSEVISTIQAVRGVEYVDVDRLEGLDEDTIKAKLDKPDSDDKGDITVPPATSDRPKPRLDARLATVKNGVIKPAQLAFLVPEVPDTLLLAEIK